MLTLRAAKGPDQYERPEFARDGYYSERGEVRGEWAGRGAGLMGLSGGPEEGDLGVLLDGRDPVSGAVLAGTARRAGGNVAFDLTFAAPKSVSVLAAVGDERWCPMKGNCALGTSARVRRPRPGGHPGTNPS